MIIYVSEERWGIEDREDHDLVFNAHKLGGRITCANPMILSNLVMNTKDRSVSQRWYQLGCQSRTGAPYPYPNHKHLHLEETHDHDITQQPK